MLVYQRVDILIYPRPSMQNDVEKNYGFPFGKGPISSWYLFHIDVRLQVPIPKKRLG
jgi:hypothetical protein